MTTITPSFSGEVQLAGWQESHNSGCKVTLWLADPSDLDAFRAMTVKKGNQSGQRLACVLVEIGDDEQPIEPEPKHKPGPLCILAVQWCKDEQFRRWLTSRTWIKSGEDYTPRAELYDEDEAKALILRTCEIESRKELDTNLSAAVEFHSRFRIPYQKFLQER